MRFKWNYVVIPALVALVAFSGSLFTVGAENWMWYDQLVQPSFTPPNWVFPVVWNTIWVMSALSAILVWNKGQKESSFLKIFSWKTQNPLLSTVVTLFLLNGILNALWSLLFFSLHRVDLAFIDILLLEATNLALVFLTWRISKTASVLLWLYAAWVALATTLNYQILILN